jgi:hypothetical protein
MYPRVMLSYQSQELSFEERSAHRRQPMEVTTAAAGRATINKVGSKVDARYRSRNDSWNAPHTGNELWVEATFSVLK